MSITKMHVAVNKVFSTKKHFTMSIVVALFEHLKGTINLCTYSSLSSYAFTVGKLFSIFMPYYANNRRTFHIIKGAKR